MVKKQNNNAWIIYLIALIAIAALVLGAIALNRANMTGNIFWDKWFDDPEPTPDYSVGGGGYCTGDGECSGIPSPTICIQTEGCYWIPEGTLDKGLFGNNYVKCGGNLENLKGLTYSIEYDSEGNVVTEIIKGIVNEEYNGDSLVGGRCACCVAINIPCPGGGTVPGLDCSSCSDKDYNYCNKHYPQQECPALS